MSVRDLAEAAEVTVPGLYYHFASKADLIQAVYQARGLGRSVAEMTPDDIPTAGPVEARVVEYARRNFARMLEDEEFLRLMHREAVLGDPDARARSASCCAVATRSGGVPCSPVRPTSRPTPTSTRQST